MPSFNTKIATAWILLMTIKPCLRTWLCTWLLCSPSVKCGRITSTGSYCSTQCTYTLFLSQVTMVTVKQLSDTGLDLSELGAKQWFVCKTISKLCL